LISNSKHDSTIVRWATAKAFLEIIKLQTKHNLYLLPIILENSKTESNNAILKTYTEAINHKIS
jgi:hypothetical protein